MKIYDGERLIRTLKQKAPKETGFHKWKWSLDEKGADIPSRSLKERNNEPSGVSVKPGTYKVMLHFGDQISEEMITVENDPRLNNNANSINEIYNISKDIEAMNQVAADAVKQLVESKKIAEDYQSHLKTLDKDKYEGGIKSSKEIVKKIDSILTLFIGKEDKRQGLVRSKDPNIVGRLRSANSYVSSRQNGITATEKRLIEHAKNALKQGLDETNTFFNQDWKTYRTAMENLDTSTFKNIKSFSLKK